MGESGFEMKIDVVLEMWKRQEMIVCVIFLLWLGGISLVWVMMPQIALSCWLATQ